MRIESILRFLRERLHDSASARETHYRDGYMDALKEALEYIEDELWYEGEEA